MGVRKFPEVSPFIRRVRNKDGTTQPKVRSQRNRQGLPDPMGAEEDYRRWRELEERQMSANEIAYAMGVAYRTVQRWRAKYRKETENNHDH